MRAKRPRGAFPGHLPAPRREHGRDPPRGRGPSRRLGDVREMEGSWRESWSKDSAAAKLKQVLRLVKSRPVPWVLVEASTALLESDGEGVPIVCDLVSEFERLGTDGRTGPSPPPPSAFPTFDPACSSSRRVTATLATSSSPRMRER